MLFLGLTFFILPIFQNGFDGIFKNRAQSGGTEMQHCPPHQVMTVHLMLGQLPFGWLMYWWM